MTVTLAPHVLRGHLAGDEAVQTVSGWMREQGESTPPRRLSRGGCWPEDPVFDLPWKDHRSFGLGWMHTIITDIFRDIENVFVGARENAAGCVLRSSKFEQHTDGSAHGRDRFASVSFRHLTSSSE